MLDERKVPKNLGIVADGNGRWAQSRGLPRSQGHTAGMENILSLLDRIFDLGTENVVCYALSTENLNRNKDEVDHILQMVFEYYTPFLDVCTKNEICVKFVGNLELFPKDVRASLNKTETALSKFKDRKRTFYLALAYGGRSEIVAAVNDAIKRGAPVTEETFLRSLQFPFDLDLIIRTGGRRRLSNFFLYQASYAELYFTDKYFPDLNQDDLTAIYQWYAKTDRTFGVTER